MSIVNIFNTVNDSFGKSSNINSRLVGTFALPDESIRNSIEFLDPKNYPFYYKFGQSIFCKNLFQIGTEYGVETGCFCSGCDMLNEVLIFTKPVDYLTSKLISGNVKKIMHGAFKHYQGDLYDDALLDSVLKNKWDIIFIHTKNSKELYEYLNFAWEICGHDKLILCDFVSFNEEMAEIFSNFCFSKNREKMIFNTRYGTGLIEK